MGTHLSRLPVAVAASVVALFVAASLAFGAYPPGPFPGPAPAGAFPTVLMSRTVCAPGATLLVEADASSVRLEVPAGAFAECTQVTIYAVDEAIVANLLPGGYAVIGAFAIGWSPDTTPAAALEFTITDAAIAPDAAAFQTTAGGVSNSTGFTVSEGQVVAAFSHATGIVVAGQQGVEGGTGAPSPAPSPGAGESNGSPNLVLVLLVIALGGVGLVGLLFARRPRPR